MRPDTAHGMRKKNFAKIESWVTVGETPKAAGK
jgi:hypothetical protein